jgi:peptidoglycan/LPS O-acetylase OafA/YrhL
LTPVRDVRLAPLAVPGRADRVLPPGLAAVLAAAAALTCYSMLAAWLRPLPGAGVVDRYLVTPLQLNANLNLLGTALLVVAGGAATAAAAHRRVAQPWLAAAVQVTVCSVVASAAGGGTFGAGTAAAVAGTLAAAAGPAFVLGELLWCVPAGRIPAWGAAGIGLAAWTVFVWGQRLGYDLGQRSNAVTLALATAIVAATLLAGARASNQTAPVRTAGSGAHGRFAFLDIFRAVAAPLVVYSHVVTMWLVPNGLGHTPVVRAVDAVLRQPLKLEQNLGQLGVALFFLVSGFIVSHAGSTESHREFGIKRFFRIYPPLAAAVLASTALGLLGLQVLDTGQRYELTPASVASNMLLVNYLTVPQIVLVGVAWTLVVEVIFYGAVLVLLPLLRNQVALALAAELLFVMVTILLARGFGDRFFLLAVAVSFLPALLTGQIIWAVWSGRMPWSAGAVFGVIAWVLYVWAGNRSLGRLDGAYCSTFALAVLIFLVGLLAEPRLRRGPVVAFLSDRSYSLYLLHGLFAFPAMRALYPRLPAPVALAVGLALTMLAVELSYRIVEVGSQRWARHLTRRYRFGIAIGGAMRGGSHRAGPARPAFAGRSQ